MRYDPERHHRRSIRLEDYDYSQAGAYFITVVTQDRVCLFGEIVAITPVGAGLVPAQHNGATTKRATTRVAPTLGDIVGAYKSLTTVQYVQGVKTYGWPPFAGRLWQRNYYEHIIRNDESLQRIRQYIVDNPARWPVDRENPLATGIPEDPW